MDRKNIIHFSGCLLGGAIGDALGFQVEFSKLATIRREFGPDGVTDFAPDTDKAKISDDTQMTMFTAEAVLRARCRFSHRGLCNPFVVTYHAYLRWLHTQGEDLENIPFKDRMLQQFFTDGWLVTVPELHHSRAPGNTCMNALSSGTYGTVYKPINNSKGCGGVMRVAPVGLGIDKRQAFQYACEVAAITHGHPSGYLSAGTLALLIAEIVDGADFAEALDAATGELKKWPNHEECLEAIQEALTLAEEAELSPETVESLGEGWVGEEALAIAIYCVKKAERDFEKGVLAAVNHGGDSDSTGSIAGNILGCLLGVDAIPQRWRDRVELADELKMLAADLVTKFEEGDDWLKRYPGW